MTYKELLTKLQKLSAEELDLEAIIEYDGEFYAASGIHHCEEKPMWYGKPPKGHVLREEYPVISVIY